MPLSVDVGTAESHGTRGRWGHGLGFGGTAEGPQRSIGSGEECEGSEQGRKIHGTYTSQCQAIHSLRRDAALIPSESMWGW